MTIYDLFSTTSAMPVSAPPHRRPRRSYSAGSASAWLGTFGSASGSADYELSQDLTKIRDRTRSLARDSGAMRRYIQLIKDNVVGENGIQLRVRVKMAVDAKKPDRSLNMRVEDAWREFCYGPTTDGQMAMVDLQKMMVSTWARDGEFIVEVVRGAHYRDGIAFNPIEGDMLEETMNTVYPASGNRIRLGVEIDQDNRPVFYHFLTQHPRDVAWSFNKKRYRRVPADRVIHIFERLRPGQTRGEPPAAGVVRNVKMLDGYREAEVTSRRIKASTMGFFTETAPDAGELDGMADENAVDYSGLEMSLEPGTFKKLPWGLDFKMFDPGGSTSDYSDFEGQIKTDISQGVSISPVSLGYETAKLSYSTHRGVIAEDRDMYRGLQGFFIRQGMRRIFLEWLPSHVSYNVDSRIPPSRLGAIRKGFKFLGRGWDYIDPSKDVSADTEQLRTRTTSLSRVTAKRGIALEDLVEEIADDEKLLAEYGLTQILTDGNGSHDNEASNDDDEA